MLIEVAVGQTNTSLAYLKQIYQYRYKADMMSAIGSDISGDFSKVILGLLAGKLNTL